MVNHRRRRRRVQRRAAPRGRPAPGTGSSQVTDILTLLDPDTGLLDRNGWDRFSLGEEERCRRYGNQASVIVVRLAEIRPRHLKAAALAVRAGSRSHDLVARVAPTELAVLAAECP